MPYMVRGKESGPVRVLVDLNDQDLLLRNKERTFRSLGMIVVDALYAGPKGRCS
jgi:hypothetical protein